MIVIEALKEYEKVQEEKNRLIFNEMYEDYQDYSTMGALKLTFNQIKITKKKLRSDSNE